MHTVSYGTDYGYAESRLDGCWLKNPSNNTFMQCVGINSSGEVILVSGSEEFHIPLEDIDLEPPKLGFMNTQKQMRYVSRMPVRHYRQGLATNNLVCAGGVSWGAKPFRTLGQWYPKPALACEEILCGETNSRAFSTDFGLKSRGPALSLVYKWWDIGTATLNSEAEQINFKIDEDWTFMNESLEEVMQNVG